MNNLNLNKYFVLEEMKEIFKIKISKSKSKGIDKKSFNSYNILEKENLFLDIKKQINEKKYKFSPYLELLRIKRRDTNPRMISIPTVKDKIVLSILKNILHEYFTESINKDQPNSYIKKIKNFIKKNQNSELFFLKTDISQFYDKINREKLKKKVKNKITDRFFINLLISSIENPTVPSNYKKTDTDYYRSKKGVPQGLPISNILAQIYLNDFDVLMIKYIDNDTLYLRYVDDILIISKTNCDEKLEKIKILLKEIGLKVNQAKTYVGKLDDTVEFLGYQISKNPISISNRTIENQINKIAGKITWFKKGVINKNARPDKFKEDIKGFENLFIKEVNEIITGTKSDDKNYGWLFYYIEVDDIKVFHKLDNIISNMIKKIPYFKNKAPSKLKKTAKAYFEIKHIQDSDYIFNYNKYKTAKQKEKLLKEVAQLDDNKKYTNEEIEMQFEYYKNRNINNLKENFEY
jgi:RNA-directed DNA polymerase